TLTLPFAPPYDWPGMLAALAARGDRHETIAGGVYRRAIAIDGAAGDVEVRLDDTAPASLRATIRFPVVTTLPGIVRRDRAAGSAGVRSGGRSDRDQRAAQRGSAAGEAGSQAARAARSGTLG